MRQLPLKRLVSIAASALLLAGTTLAQAETLRLLTWGNYAPDKVVQMFEEKYPDITVEVTVSNNEEMVAKMAEAGFASVFLGIENVSRQNLNTACKGDIVASVKKAVENCQKCGIMVIGGLIFGFPEDNEVSIRKNYEFFREIQCDAAYCQILTPYPKTGIREHLLEQGLLTNPEDYRKYNGLWANVRTKYLDSDQLQYQFWYQRQVVLGWWTPSSQTGKQDRLWILIWRFLFKPFLQLRYKLMFDKDDWTTRYEQEINRMNRMNRFADLEEFGE